MNTQLDTALSHWHYVAPLLTTASNESDYQLLVESLDSLLDAGAADETHPLAGLTGLTGLTGMIGELISSYEQQHYPIPPEMSGIEALLFFMVFAGNASSRCCSNRLIPAYRASVKQPKRREGREKKSGIDAQRKT